MPKLSIIIPCYYNEENIPITSKILVETEKLFPPDVEVEYVMIDDGSKDGTLDALNDFFQAYPKQVKILKLAGNVGSYNAILAGMAHATGDCCTVIAADLQDPPEMIPKMYEYWRSGIKLVIANRQDRDDPFLTKIFANIFQSLIRKFGLKQLPEGGFDFVLFDKQLKDEVVAMDEKNTNVLYLLSWLGYDYVNIPYKRREREVGKSRWTFTKKLKLFIDSFVAFSFFPIRIISLLGLVLGGFALAYALFIIGAKLFGWVPVEGWTSVMVVLLTVSSFQMIALGIIGEYVWRGLDAARKRPNYVIESIQQYSEDKQALPEKRIKSNV
ncbi:MAG: glycosyltransferase family 2 protein [Bacteroidota bacterium]